LESTSREVDFTGGLHFVWEGGMNPLRRNQGF
jgi:hypothetical protein